MKHAALTASINVSRANLLLESSVFLSTFSDHLLAGRTPALDEDLKRGAEKFVAVVESKNPSPLLDLFSEQGRSFISISGTEKFAPFEAGSRNGMVGLILTDVPPPARQGRGAGK